MSKPAKNLIILTVILVVLVGLLVFVNYENERKKAGIFQLKDNIKTHDSLPEETEIQKRITDLNKKKNTVELFLLDKDDPIAFIKTIENLAEQHSLTAFVENADSFRLFEGEDVLGGGITLMVNLDGSLLNSRNFLYALENLNKEVDIKSVRLSRDTIEDGNIWRVFFNVIGKTK
jgi:hypothetical protein